jgi:membrane protein
MTKNAWRDLVQFGADLARRFFGDRLTQTAGSLTYTTLLALVPLLTVVLSVSTAFPIFDRFVEGLQDFVLENFLPDTGGAEMIARQLNMFVERATQLTAIGLSVLGVTTIMLMLTIDDVLNRIFRVAQQRPLHRRLAMYFAVLVLGPILIGASVSMTTYLVVEGLGALTLDWLTQAVLRVLPFVFTCAALMSLYILVPNRKVNAVHALGGAFFASIVFEIAKRAFAIYVSRVPTYTIVYGAFATMLVFLVWLYMSWVIVLAGATLSAMLPGYRRETETAKENL